MKKLCLFMLAVASLSLISCANDDDLVDRKPVLPQSSESDMPWNRPTGPEGAGALGVLAE